MGNGTIKEARLGFAERCLRYFSYAVIHLVQRPKLMSPLTPLGEPTIFACRHVGLIDPVILMVCYFRKMVRPLVAKDYYDVSNFTRKFYRTAQCIPLDRRNPSKQWLEESLAALEKGESVLIFPEGKRNKTGEGLLPFHHGAALLALRSGARIVPVYNAVWKFPHRYRLATGAPLYLQAPAPGEDEAQWLKDQTARIQQAVAELAPIVEGKR